MSKRKGIRMKYMGSKSRLSKELVPIIQSYIDVNTKGYLEPFVGGANVIDKIDCKVRVGMDIHEYLVPLLVALRDGWIPPQNITEDEYKSIKNNKEGYPKELVGYVGFQLSYGAKWFGGYRRDKIGKRNYSLEAYNNTIKQIELLKGIEFYKGSFLSIPLEEVSGYVIYCDPPYKNTTSYATSNFPYDEFYKWCETASKNNVVLISEYSMPENKFECIWEKSHKTLINSTKKKDDGDNDRTERLFICTKKQ